MTTPLTLPTDYALPASGLIAVGVKGERPSFGVDVGDPGPPSWAQEMADEKCQTCNGTGEYYYDDAPPRLDGCPDCVDGKPYRPVRIECDHPYHDTTRLDGGWGVCVPGGCDNGFRTVGSAAVLAVVPVLDEDESAPPGCDRFIFLPHPGRSWLLFDSSDGTARSESIHFPNAQDHDWAIVCKVKETS